MTEQKRYGEHRVTLKHPRSTRELHGVEFTLYPVDEPPIIIVEGRRWYRTVWERQGWKASDAP